MIKAFLDSLEDAERPLLGPNYWLLTKVGLILPKNKFKRCLSICWQELLITYFISAIYELYVIRENVDLVMTNLKISVLGLILNVKSNIFVFRQKQWLELLGYITESDRYERDNCNDIKGNIIDKYTKYCRRITYSYTCLILTTCVTTITTPPMVYLSSSTLRQNIKDGSEPFPHILSSWMPFDKNHSPGNWITVVWHIILILWGTGLMPAVDSVILVTMVFFRGKLELLRESSRQMLGTGGKGTPDEEANRILRELHHNHVMLINPWRRWYRQPIIKKYYYLSVKRYLKLFNSLISPIMFMYVIVLSIMLCASAYQLTAASTVIEKLTMMEYLLFGIAQMFMFCWHSTDVLVKHEQLMQGPYESEWWCANSRQRKSIVMLTEQFSISHVFTAGPFTNLTLATFVTIIKGAYSYFTLLRD